MQSHLYKAGLFAAVLVLLASGSATAATMEVKVPFPFTVQGKALPAGQYRVTEEEGVVQLQGEHKNHKENVFFLAVPVSGHDPEGDKPTLSFSHSENQYQLSDIWESGAFGLAPAKR